MYNVYPQRSLPTIPLSPLPRKCNSIVRSRTFQDLMFARFIVGPSQQPRSQKGWWWLGLPVFISSHPQNVCVYGRESVKRRFFFFFDGSPCWHCLPLSRALCCFCFRVVHDISSSLFFFFKFYTTITNDSTLSIVYFKKKEEIIRVYDIRDNIDNIGKLAVRSNASKWLLERSRLEYSRGP